MPEEADDAEFDRMLAERRKRLQRKENRRFMTVFGIGGAIFIFGAAVAIGNETGEWVTIPIGRILMGFGGFICGLVGVTWKSIKVG